VQSHCLDEPWTTWCRRSFILRTTLQRIVDKNQEQEVRGIALPVVDALPMVDAVLTAARKRLPSDDPVLDAIAGLVTPAAIAESEPIRTVDS
jgi:hypothetical protein